MKSGFLTGALVVCALALAAAGPAAANSPGTKSRLKQFEKQTRVLDNRGASQYNDSVRYRPDAIVSSRGLAPFRAANYSRIYVSMARNAARKHRVPESLFLRLVEQESRFNPQAVSHKGAIGLAQLMPGTARMLGVNPRDPKQNLEGGARYLRTQYERFRSWRLALAAYNAGPEAVARYDGVPPYKETEHYVKKILGL